MKKNLKKILKKSDKINDIILYGSFVKGRGNPKDIDIAFITNEKDIKIISEIKEEVGLSQAHIDFITLDDVFGSLFLSLINEGYSIKKDSFLRDALNIRPMRIYSYDLKHLDKSKKTLFGIALKKCLGKINGEKAGLGAVLVPISQTSYFEDFLDVWGMKYKTKEWTVI